MSEEVEPQRLVPAALGYSKQRVAEPFDKLWDQLWVTQEIAYRGLRVAFFGPSGSGKSEIAAQLHRELMRMYPMLAPVTAPWVSSAWLADHLRMPNAHDAVTGEPLRQLYVKAKLLTVDGLGEEDPKGRLAVDALIRQRVDNDRAVIITSRLPLQGMNSLADLYPGLMTQLGRFYFAVA